MKLVFLLSEPTFARLALPRFCLSVLNFAVGVEDVLSLTWPSFSYTCLSATVELVTPGDDQLSVVRDAEADVGERGRVPCTSSC